MTASVPQKTPTEKTRHYAALVRDLLEQYDIDPTPENYAILYHYVMAENPELVKEVDELIQRNLFTAELGRSLHRKYLEQRGDAIAEDTAAVMQKTLASILQAVDSYSGETAQHSKQLGEQAAKLQESSGDEPVQGMVQEIINRVSMLRSSGDEFTAKMNDSSKEIEKLRKDLDKATKASQYDFLTGIYNRKKLEEELQENVTKAKEEDEELSLLMLDIDHFKRFNDQFGHALGDEVLKIVAAALKESVRGKDVVARYGGEEFTVILPSTPLKGAEVVAESIRKRIAGRELKRKDTGEIIAQITVSIGVSLFRPASDTSESLMKRADAALYKAKAAGRNRVKKEGE